MWQAGNDGIDVPGCNFHSTSVSDLAIVKKIHHRDTESTEDVQRLVQTKISQASHDGLELLVPPSMLDDDINILQQVDVAQHIPTHGDNVGVLSFADGAHLIRDFH